VKKFIVAVLGVLFVLGIAASAFADAVTAKDETKITMGGEIRVRGWYVDNITGTRRATSRPSDSHSQAWYDQRVRLSLNAEVSKNTTGFIMLETGASGTTDVNTWGTLNSKNGTLDGLREAWILTKGSGLGIPAGLKIGHMPLKLGEGQFLDHTKFGDDAIVFFMDPTKELHIGVLTAKWAEGSTPTNSYGDTNGYVVLGTYKMGSNTFGINYARAHADATDFSFQNLGLHANGDVAGFMYKFEYDQQFGNQSATVKYKGYGVMLGLGYKINPVTIRGMYAMGSGDVVADNKNKEFQTTLGNDVNHTFVYDYTTFSAANSVGGGQTVAGNTRSTGLANTAYYKLGVDLAPTKDLSASLDYIMLRAVKATAGSSKKIGSEYDLKMAYKIEKNLTYSVMAGYLDTGKWWEGDGGVTTTNNKNIMQLMHALTLSF